MAGHSKFKNIQFRKDRQDSMRSKLFSKLSRDITIAAKHGVPDPAANSRLRLAIANAKAESMPKDNIDRAIKKGQAGDADTLEEIRYPASAGSDETVLDAAIEAGAQDTETDEGGHVILTAFEDLGPVAEALEASLGQPTSAQIVWRPKSDTPVSGQEAATLVKLIGALEDDDDVQNVWTNADVDEAEIAKLAG